MTGDELKAARFKLGYSHRELAEALGMNGKNSHGTLRKMERGKGYITPRIAALIEKLMQQEQEGK